MFVVLTSTQPDPAVPTTAEISGGPMKRIVSTASRGSPMSAAAATGIPVAPTSSLIDFARVTSYWWMSGTCQAAASCRATPRAIAPGSGRVSSYSCRRTSGTDMVPPQSEMVQQNTHLALVREVPSREATRDSCGRAPCRTHESPRSWLGPPSSACTHRVVAQLGVLRWFTSWPRAGYRPLRRLAVPPVAPADLRAIA
jgi:hypothetical protein